MSKHFKVLGFLANSFPQIAFNTASVAAIALTDIEVAGKDSRYILAMVGTDMKFTVLCDDAIIDSITTTSHEDESHYAGRIVTMIAEYS